MPGHGYLADWAKQGYCFLNTVLTVRRGQANSHKGKGWEIFTDRIVEILNQRQKPMVFILWGANAKSKTELITNKRTYGHHGSPSSPLSAWKGFLAGDISAKPTDIWR